VHKQSNTIHCACLSICLFTPKKLEISFSSSQFRGCN